MSYITEYKDLGYTMNQFLEQIHLKYPGKKYTFTARLDPMACGLVPLIEKKDFKDFDSYLSSNKKYTVQIILGLQTDSDDVLGMIESIDLDYLKYTYNPTNLYSYFEKEYESFEQKYHYFSTKRLIARMKGKEDGHFKHIVSIFNSNVKDFGVLNFNEWVDSICSDIEKVDKTKKFRQKEIIEQWNNLKNKDYILNYIDLELNVSSGFFVRQFIRDINEKSKIPMLAYKITRKSVY